MLHDNPFGLLITHWLLWKSHKVWLVSPVQDITQTIDDQVHTAGGNVLILAQFQHIVVGTVI